MAAVLPGMAGAEELVREFRGERSTETAEVEVEAIDLPLAHTLAVDGAETVAIDGFIGPNTRSQIGTYQLRNGLAVDCWPSEALLATMQRLSDARDR